MKACEFLAAVCSATWATAAMFREGDKALFALLFATLWGCCWLIIKALRLHSEAQK